MFERLQLARRFLCVKQTKQIDKHTNTQANIG